MAGRKKGGGYGNLETLILVLNNFLIERLKLVLHPNKIEIRNLSQGIDFLGYVTLPYHLVLRTKTKRRILKRLNKNNYESYFGLLKHCNGHKIKQQLKTEKLLFSRVANHL